MACGNFLAKLDHTKRFALSIPTFLIPPQSVLCQSDDAISLNLISDDGEVGVLMQISSEDDEGGLPEMGSGNLSKE